MNEAGAQERETGTTEVRAELGGRVPWAGAG